MQENNYSLQELARITESRLIGNPEHCISDVSDLESATATDASFLANARYETAMNQSLAGVIFISPTISLMTGRNFLVNENPSKAFQQVVDLIHKNSQEFTGFKEIHPSAVIHESCQISPNVVIGPLTVLDKGVKVGEGSIIGAGCYVGPHSVIGSNCYLHPKVTIRERCLIGNRVIIQPGAVIGSCGFGYLTDKQGKHTKLNQVGIVIIEDDVEIGANTTIDRARFKATCIKRGTKIDNLVQIGHGVVIGEDNIIVAQTGIAGSTSTGRHVVIGGQVAIAGHLKIANGTMLAGKSGVTKSIGPGKYNGVPAIPLNEYNKTSVYLRNIETYVKQIKELTQRIESLEQGTCCG